ncbi:MFS transporter [Bradyrhizobium macuxiense]|uniref:MFS transporter n=1 Tax=Bradyrhizobium macuxiense TaxID=1755647 RepID=A0A109K1P7_9BRAD|nr:cyanate transporter [Bradyrhizobium macuxiense]KWV59070.1 MFS transporter [Bradyrhizobium macuxiense]
MAKQSRIPSTALLLSVVILVGMNLRPFLTVVGPLATDIRDATGLGFQSMSLFTLVPMVLMGLLALTGSRLQATVGARSAVIGALVILTLASALRLVPMSGIALIATAALCGLGVSIIQATFPGIIKAYFPRHVAAVMGLYSSMLMAGGALGAQIGPAVAETTGSWQLGLAWTTIPALAAVVVSWMVLPHDRSTSSAGIPVAVLLRRPRTWLLILGFGLMNGGYSSVIAWLAPYYQSLGWTAAASGSVLATMATCQAIAAVSIPVLASRSEDRRLWIWLTLMMQIAGFAGLALAPLTSPLGWAALVGAGLGGCFPLFMVVALDHFEHPAHAGALSALMQGGFLIAAIPPWLVAVLHDASGGFTAGWLMHLGCAASVAILSLRFAPHSYARVMKIAAAARADI